MGQPHGIGIVGLGVISRAYLDVLASHPDARIVAVADLDAARAEAVAAETGARALTVEQLLADPEVETVLNLTIPAAHAEIALGAISHGKDVFGEKPLAATLAEARAVMDAAASAGRQVGSAPDTVLGTGTQTARAAVDAGLIGRPTSALATFVSPGHELWHPAPDFYYRNGGGPLLDMGPYYVSSLVQILGPVVSVIGAASRTRDTRIIASGPRAGEEIPVEVATHVTGVLEHRDGALSTLTVSFDGVRTAAHPIEIHGEAGTILVPDPNTFDGDVRLLRVGETEWTTLEPSAGYVGGSRGAGLLDFAAGDRRASGEIAYHALEIMEGVLRAAESGCRVQIASAPERPTPVPLTHDWR